MHNVIVGTAGHVDHGKTCLIKALTGIDTDRLKEEKKRGITIELGFAEMPNCYNQHIGIIDVPGHERFVSNMLAGIGGIDIVLLVVAADEGMMPQTIEHLEIIKMLHIKKGIIVLTKADTVEPEWIDMVSDDIKATVKGTFLEGAHMLPVSSFTGQNIEELKELICRMVKDLETRREDSSLLRIPIDRVFTIDGFGTVVTGTLVEGSVTVGSKVQIYPGEKSVKVRNLQVHGNMVDTAYAGQRTAVNLLNVKKEEINRGDVLAAIGSMKQTRMLDVKIQMFDNAPRTLLNGSRVHFYYGSAEVLCKVVLLDKQTLESGREGYAQLRLEEEISVKKGDRFIIRFYSPMETIGGGIVIDANPIKHKRFRHDVLDALAVKETGDMNEILEQTVRDGSKTLMSYKTMASKLGRTEQEFIIAIEALISEGKVIRLSKDLCVHMDFMRSVQEVAVNILTEYHDNNPISQGMKKGEFCKKLSNKIRIDEPKAIKLFFCYLLENEVLLDKGNLISLFGFLVEYKQEQVEIQKRIEKSYLDYGYKVPELEEIIAGENDKKMARQLVGALCEEGKLKRLTSQYFMHSTHWNAAMTLLENHIEQQGKISPGEFRDLLGTSRKYAVMILDYLDDKKVGPVVAKHFCI